MSRYIITFETRPHTPTPIFIIPAKTHKDAVSQAVVKVVSEFRVFPSAAFSTHSDTAQTEIFDMEGSVVWPFLFKDGHVFQYFPDQTGPDYLEDAVRRSNHYLLVWDTSPKPTREHLAREWATPEALQAHELIASGLLCPLPFMRIDYVLL